MMDRKKVSQLCLWMSHTRNRNHVRSSHFTAQQRSQRMRQRAANIYARFLISRWSTDELTAYEKYHMNQMQTIGFLRRPSIRNVRTMS